MEGRKQPVVVVQDTEGHPRDLRRTGADFDWTAYFQELEARGLKTPQGAQGFLHLLTGHLA